MCIANDTDDTDYVIMLMIQRIQRIQLFQIFPEGVYASILTNQNIAE